MNSADGILGARHPASEAAAAVGDALNARVLEPSPPSVTEAPFWADDPAHPQPADGRPVVTPHSGGDLTWDELIQERPELAGFAADRWLGARRPLPPLPSDYPAALFDLHRLAYSVVAETRYRVNGKFGLRYTMGGFGTPFFGNDTQVRVADGRLVVQEAGRARSTAISTLREAAEFAGIAPGTVAAEHDSPEIGDLDRHLDARPEVCDFLGAWFGLAFAVLEELRFTPDVTDPERVQLWPGHFDAAMAVGDADAGLRATYGFSPGDRDHSEPYVYVAAWGGIDRSDPFWNDPSFNGASLTFSRLAAGTEHCGSALEFLRAGYARLNSG